MIPTTDQIDHATHLLDDAREAYSAFQAAWSQLGDAVRYIDEMTHVRVEAYPGWHGTRDVGAGVDQTGWMDTVAEAIDDARAERAAEDAATPAHDPDCNDRGCDDPTPDHADPATYAEAAGPSLAELVGRDPR